MASLTTPEWAVRMTVRAISSTRVSSPLRITSKVIGSMSSGSMSGSYSAPWTSMTMFPAWSRLAAQVGGTTVVASYSSTMSGPC